MAGAIRLHRARRRREQALTLVEGPHTVAEAAAAAHALRTVFVVAGDGWRELAEKTGAAVVEVTEQVLARLATTETPQSPVAVAEIPSPAPLEPGHVLCAWGIGDPGNVGTMLRTAAAFGLGFATGPGTADPWSPKVIRSAAGAQFGRPPAAIASLDAVTDHRIVATVPRGGVAPVEPAADPTPSLILVGGEGSGLSPDVIAAAAATVTIPMVEGVESLNAAVAGAIVAHAFGVGRAGSGRANLPAP